MFAKDWLGKGRSKMCREKGEKGEKGEKEGLVSGQLTGKYGEDVY